MSFKRIKNWSLFLMMVIMMGCQSGQNGHFFDRTVRFEDDNWQRFNNLEFNVPVKKGLLLDFNMVLQYDGRFTGRMFPVNVTFYSPGGESRSRNINYELTDRRTKQRKGETLNGVTTVKLPIRNEMPFGEDGVCKVVIEKKIPKLNTYGILSLELIADESSVKKAQ